MQLNCKRAYDLKTLSEERGDNSWCSHPFPPLSVDVNHRVPVDLESLRRVLVRPIHVLFGFLLLLRLRARLKAKLVVLLHEAVGFLLLLLRDRPAVGNNSRGGGGERVVLSG